MLHVHVIALVFTLTSIIGIGLFCTPIFTQDIMLIRSAVDRVENWIPALMTRDKMISEYDYNK